MSRSAPDSTSSRTGWTDVARDRSQGRRAQKEAARAAQVADLRQEARAWYIRAFLALAAAVGLSFLTVLLAAIPAALTGWCIVEGTKRAIEATKLEEQR